MATPGPSWTHMASNAATNVIKASAGQLFAVVINTKGSSSNVLTLYDNASAASGTLIATVDTTAATGTLNFQGLGFVNGLTVSLATGGAADLTFVWI